VEHFYIKIGDPSCIIFGDITQKNTHTQMALKTLPPQLPSVWANKKKKTVIRYTVQQKT